MTDNELKELILDSPHRGCRELVDQYGNLIYAIVLNKLKNTAEREDIEDCVSTVVAEVYQSIKQQYVPEEGSLKGFISTIAKRTAIDTYRKLTYRNNRTSYIDEEEMVIVSDEAGPEEQTEQKIENHELWLIVKELGEPDSSIIMRQYFYEQPVKDIAAALSMTAAAVQKRSVRAREKLKKIIGVRKTIERGGSYE